MPSRQKKRSEIIVSLILVFVDAGMLFVAAASAYWLRFSSTMQDLRPVLYNLPPKTFLLFAAYAIPVWLIVFALAGLYSMRGNRRMFDELARIFVACSLGILLLIVVFFLQREFFSSRFIVIVLWFFSVLFVSTARIIVRTIQHLLFRRNIGNFRILVIGNDETTAALLAALQTQPRLGLVAAARLQNLPSEEQKIRQTLKQIQNEKRIDGVILADPDITRNQRANVLAFCQENHLDFRYTADLFDAQAINVRVLPIGGIPVVEIKPTPLDGWGRVAKRIFDIIVSLFCIIIFSPIMFITAAAVLLDSGFPILWRRLDDGRPAKRIGVFGEPFVYFKFRSMHVSTHGQRYNKLSRKNVRADGPLVKIPNDPRITRVGKIIRALSIDELPELFLVLAGKMSLVGPRPHLPEEVEKYPERARKVLQIKPGMTGLSQISGRSSLSFDDEIRLDSYYIENWSLALDLLILLKTPFIVLTRPIKA